MSHMTDKDRTTSNSDDEFGDFDYEDDDLDEVAPPRTGTLSKQRPATKRTASTKNTPVWLVPLIVVGALVLGLGSFFVARQVMGEKLSRCEQTKAEMQDLMQQYPAGGTNIPDSLGIKVADLGQTDLHKYCSYDAVVEFEGNVVFPWFGDAATSDTTPAPTDTTAGG